MYLCTKFQKRNKLRYLTVMVISNKPLRFILASLVACLPLISFANPTEDTAKVVTEVAHEVTENGQGEAHAEPTDVKSKVKGFIKHHVLDSHEFSFFQDDETGVHYGFALPIIIWDNGFQIFSSSKFKHGEAVAESNGNFYKINHHDGKIYKTDAAGTITEDEESGHPTNVRPLDFSITKSVLSIMIAAILMFFIFSSLSIGEI